MQSHSGQRPETLKAPRKIGARIDDGAGGDEKPATADNSSIEQAWERQGTFKSDGYGFKTPSVTKSFV